MATNKTPSTPKSSKPTPIRDVLSVPLASVRVDFAFNARGKENVTTGVEALAADMAATGQLTPVVVQPNPDGTFTLLAGFRRYAAAAYLGWPTIKATAWTPDGKRTTEDVERDAFLVNLKENVVRKNLSTYELAHALLRLRDDHGMTANGAASALAAGNDDGTPLTKGYVNRLISLAARIHPEIQRAWSDANHPAHRMADTNRLAELVKYDHETQLAKWQAILGNAEAAGDADGENADADGTDADGADKPTKERARATRQSELHILGALEACKRAKDLPAAWRDGAMAALTFALGKVSTLKAGDRAVYDVEMAKSQAAASRAATKAQDKERSAEADARAAMKGAAAGVPAAVAKVVSKGTAVSGPAPVKGKAATVIPGALAASANRVKGAAVRKVK